MLAYTAIFIICSCLTVKLRAAPLQFVGLTVRVLRGATRICSKLCPAQSLMPGVHQNGIYGGTGHKHGRLSKRSYSPSEWFSPRPCMRTAGGTL